MPSDATTFFLGFLAVFGLLGGYLVRLELQGRRLEARLASLQPSPTREMKGPPPGNQQG